MGGDGVSEREVEASKHRSHGHMGFISKHHKGG